MVYLADADSKLPNLAIMRMGTYFRALGQPVCLVTPNTKRDLFNHRLGDGVYGSSIFTKSAKQRAAIEAQWGYVKWGGTGVNVQSSLDEIDPKVDWDSIGLDYSLYPAFDGSIGFLTRGCRLKCGFCVVPTKEGKPRLASTVEGLWRGAPYPRHLHLHLLDNDAFAKPLRDFWYGVVDELNHGNFKVCFSQGINVRLIDDEAASMIASVRYYGNDFGKRILYTAWDNYRDEKIFRDGVARLNRAGIPSNRLRVFMLVGYRKGETWEEIFYRFSELVLMGAEPYVMVYGDEDAEPALLAFERWANHHLWRSVPWPQYGREAPHIDRRLTGETRRDADDAWRRVVGRMLADADPVIPTTKETPDERA